MQLISFIEVWNTTVNGTSWFWMFSNQLYSNYSRHKLSSTMFLYPTHNWSTFFYSSVFLFSCCNVLQGTEHLYIKCLRKWFMLEILLHMTFNNIWQWVTSFVCYQVSVSNCPNDLVLMHKWIFLFVTGAFTKIPAHIYGWCITLFKVKLRH